MKRFLLGLVFLPAILLAGPTQFVNPAILSFENGVAPALAGRGSHLTVSDQHYKHLTHSLEWTWNAPGAQWFVQQPVDYKPHDASSKNNSIATFVFWVYSEKPLKDQKLTVEFLKKGKVCSWFSYGLDFTGWRGAWIAFDRDMQGKPEQGMDEMRVTAPQTASGTLWFDHIILCSYQDARQHTADFQAPFINPETDNHWLVLLKSWNKKFDLPLPENVTTSDLRGADIITERLTSLILEGRKPSDISEIKNRYDEYGIVTNPDGSVRGLPVFQERYGETYDYLGAENYTKTFGNVMGVSRLNDLMFKIAVTYTKTDNPEDKKELADMFVQLTRHMLDQGFQAGSALGTLHHLGYNMKEYYLAAFLMKNVLAENQLQDKVQQAMEWFAGTGEVKTAQPEPGMDIDAFNTSLIGRLASVLMLNDNRQKVRYLHAMTRWIDNGFLYTSGTEDAFKPDGSIYHHRHNYPAYAIGGLDGAVKAVWLLNKTPFEINTVGRQHLKDALLAMRTYCNLITWPLSLSGRHPDGKGHLIPDQFARLATAGSPDGKQAIDTTLAAAYLRLVAGKPTKYSKLFLAKGFKAEKSPEGNRSFSYSCMDIHRRNDWMVCAMGFSRYLWATETYVGANMYGRYLNHGSLQILATGNPVSLQGSGFHQEGWDWNHNPGTTAAVIPLEKLCANVKNLDAESGYEEMLLSDETFAGGLSFKGRQGIFAMKLHENAKYNGSLHARKSVFFFDNRIVALGSDIRSALPGSSVQTTLFQNYKPVLNSPVLINGEPVRQFPFSEQLKGTLNYLSDGLGNYFFVRNGTIHVSVSHQHSFDQETEKPTEGDFALAAIDHGAEPAKAGYEYLVLVQPTAGEVSSVQKKSPYQVLQCDSLAHIVYDTATGITGYALFEAGKINLPVSVVKETDTPCMVMVAQDQQQLSLSICDPDLHFYEGKTDEKYDSNGKPQERSVYSRRWVKNPSAPSEIKFVLKGRWTIDGENPYFKVVSEDNRNTTVSVTCQHGFSREVVFRKK